MKKSTPRLSRSSFKKLPRSFFRRPARELAKVLIGKILVRLHDGEEFRARVVETEAYLGPRDLASHASKGWTRRTQVLFGPAGRAYVYLIYGMYDMLNVVAGAAGLGQAVLIRAAEPLDGWNADLSGPGKLARALHVTISENGLDLAGAQLFFLDNPGYQPRLASAKRVGIDYARKWKDARLRFLDADCRARSLRGTQKRRKKAQGQPYVGTILRSHSGTSAPSANQISSNASRRCD
jgi:DNA-3-methyladenine glycosylase